MFLSQNNKIRKAALLILHFEIGLMPVKRYLKLKLHLFLYRVLNWQDCLQTILSTSIIPI